MIYISNFERPKSQSNISRGEFDYLLKETKSFTHLPYHFANLEVHAVHALFSPESLPATRPRLSPTQVEPPNYPHFLQIVSDLKFPKCLSNYSRRITNHPFRTFTVNVVTYSWVGNLHH